MFCMKSNTSLALLAAYNMKWSNYGFWYVFKGLRETREPRGTLNRHGKTKTKQRGVIMTYRGLKHSAVLSQLSTKANFSSLQ